MKKMNARKFPGITCWDGKSQNLVPVIFSPGKRFHTVLTICQITLQNRLETLPMGRTTPWPRLFNCIYLSLLMYKRRPLPKGTPQSRTLKMNLGNHWIFGPHLDVATLNQSPLSVFCCYLFISWACWGPIAKPSSWQGLSSDPQSNRNNADIK